MIPENIIFSRDAAADLRGFLTRNSYSAVAALVDENTELHCFPAISEAAPGIRMIRIRSGEEEKNINTCLHIWRELTGFGFDRKALLINLGGGVIGDMGGFCAATYKRGIDFINIPTTLLSQVDASIGGKLGIDFENFKNHIGLFREPDLVIVDPAFLNTLDRLELRSGFAEVIKHSLIADAGYWPEISGQNFENQNWSEHIAHSIEVKSQVVARDPKESGLRKILNFGHTIGHAIESYYLNIPGKKLLHGEAIAIGMICEAFLSYRKTGLPQEDLKAISEYLVSVFGRPEVDPQLAGVIAGLALQDKKNYQGQVNAALLARIGEAVYDIPVNGEDIFNALSFYASL